MKIKNKKKIFSYLLTIFVGGGLFFLAAPAHANWAADVIGGLLGLIIGGLGLILALIMQALVAVAQYSNFIHAPAISNGWVVVRDVCNMFFVLILLIIAFATILKVENYSYKKWLPKLILMAILINFSKTICGLLIDFAQVVMLTFVNAFKDMAAGNMVTALGIQDILTLADNSETVGFWEIIGAYLLGLIYIIIAMVVIVTMLAMLVMRIVMIWIYVVLSPAAYLMSAFPGGQKYASQWWSEFSKNLIVGPVLAFFIWLSFVSLQTQDISGDFPTSTRSTTEVASEVGISGPSDENASSTAMAASQASTPGAFIKFIIAIGMLIGGLKISQEIGGAAGSIAGKGMSKINKGALVAGGAIGGFALARAKQAGRTVRNQSLGLVSAATKGTGSLINKVAGGDTKVGGALKAAGGIGLAWRADMMFKNKKRKTEERQKFLEKIGMGGKTMEKTSEFLKTSEGKNLTNFAGATGTGIAMGSGLGVAGAAVGGVIGAGVAGLQAIAPKIGQWLNQKGDAQTNIGNPGWGNVLRFLGKGANSIQSYTTDLTQRAAAKGGKKITDAKTRVSATAADPDFMKGQNGAAPATFYTKSGQSDDAREYFNQLVNEDNPDSGAAIAALTDFINNEYVENDDAKTDARFQALMQGIAAFKKGGGDTSRLNGLITAMDSKNTAYGTVASNVSKVVANRKTGTVGEKGSGGFYVDTFANNGGSSGNVAGKNVIGVDFNKLKDVGLDASAEASIATGDSIAPIAKAISEQIAAEKINLTNLKADGKISEEDFTKQNSDLDRAQERLSNPDELSNLNLVNTASANFGRQERMTSVYHEEIHAGGVEDEDLTEGMAKKLMENKLYGRNSATGGRHATEIAQKAKEWKDQGMDNNQVMAKVDDEIKSRLSSEGKSRAERVANLEAGKKETESQATGAKVGEIAINADEFQKSLDSLAEKVKKTASSFQLSPAAGKGTGTDSLLFPLKQLNINMRKNVASMKALSAKTGGEAPTTIIEASAINDEISS